MSTDQLPAGRELSAGRRPVIRRAPKLATLALPHGRARLATQLRLSHSPRSSTVRGNHASVRTRNTSVTRKWVREAKPGRRAARVLAVLAIAVATAMSIADPASAHATLSSSNPTAGAILTRAPAAVSLHFDEAVTTVPGSLRVLGPDGSRADAGTVSHPGGNGNDLAVDLRDATKQGSYFVSWRAVSADSHPISGAFTFAVGTTSAAPAGAAVTDAGSGAALALGLSRWAGYLGLVLLLGGAVFLSLCWPRGWAQRRARLLLTAGWAVGLAGALLGLVFKGPYDAGLGWDQVGRWDLLTEVLDTTYGKALIARIVLLAGIAIWLGRRARTPHGPGTPSRWAGVLVAVALLATFSATGHAVVGSGGWDIALVFTSDMAHLAAMAVWVGGLVMLATVLLPSSQSADAAEAVPVYSWLATVSVAVLVVTGSYQAWRQVGSLPALAGTTYGRELIVKLALVAVVLSFAAASRVWVRRHYRSAPVVVYAASASDLLDPRPAHPRAEVAPVARRSLRRSVAVEAVITMIVLAVTAALVATAPARTAYRPSVEESLQLGPGTAQVSAVPAGDREMDLHIFLLGPIPEEVTATLRLPAQDLGPLPVTLQGFGDGHEVGIIAVPVPGDWILTVSARTTAFDVFTKDMTVPIR
jgi:copper transport protein